MGCKYVMHAEERGAQRQIHRSQSGLRRMTKRMASVSNRPRRRPMPTRGSTAYQSRPPGQAGQASQLRGLSSLNCALPTECQDP